MQKIKETCKWKLGTIKERNSKSTFRKVEKIKREIRRIKERNAKINIRKVKKGKLEIAYMHMKGNPLKWNKNEFKIEINQYDFIL